MRRECPHKVLLKGNSAHHRRHLHLAARVQVMAILHPASDRQ